MNEPAEAAIRAADDIEDIEISRYRRLGPFWLTVVFVLTAAATVLAINQIFNLGFFVGYVLVMPSYLYLIGGIMLGMLFLVMPATASAPRDRVPWYDVAMFFFTLVMTVYLFAHGYQIQEEAWEYNAPLHGRWMPISMPASPTAPIVSVLTR